MDTSPKLQQHRLHTALQQMNFSSVFETRSDLCSSILFQFKTALAAELELFNQYFLKVTICCSSDSKTVGWGLRWLKSPVWTIKQFLCSATNSTTAVQVTSTSFQDFSRYSKKRSGILCSCSSGCICRYIRVIWVICQHYSVLDEYLAAVKTNEAVKKSKQSSIRPSPDSWRIVMMSLVKALKE